MECDDDGVQSSTVGECQCGPSCWKLAAYALCLCSGAFLRFMLGRTLARWPSVRVAPWPAGSGRRKRPARPVSVHGPPQTCSVHHLELSSAGRQSRQPATRNWRPPGTKQQPHHSKAGSALVPKKAAATKGGRHLVRGRGRVKVRLRVRVRVRLRAGWTPPAATTARRPASPAPSVGVPAPASVSSGSARPPRWHARSPRYRSHARVSPAPPGSHRRMPRAAPSRLGHCAEIVLGVKLTPDAVDRGKGAADKGEDRRELNHAIIHHPLQLAAHLLGNVLGGAACGLILEVLYGKGAHLLKRHCVGRLVNKAHLLHAFHQLARRDAQLLDRWVGAAAKEREGGVAQPTLRVIAEGVHHPKVVEDEPPLGVDAHVAREDVDHLLGELLAIEAELGQRLLVCELDRFDELHSEQALGGGVGVDARHLVRVEIGVGVGVGVRVGVRVRLRVGVDARHNNVELRGQTRGEALRVLGLVVVVDLEVEQPRRVVGVLQPITAGDSCLLLHLRLEEVTDARHQPNVGEVGVEELGQVAPLHLDGNLLALVHGAVHLAERGACERLQLERVEDALHRGAQLRVDDRGHALAGDGGHRVLQRDECVDVGLREEVGPRRGDLAELDHRRAEAQQLAVTSAATVEAKVVGARAAVGRVAVAKVAVVMAVMAMAGSSSTRGCAWAPGGREASPEPAGGEQGQWHGATLRMLPHPRSHLDLLDLALVRADDLPGGLHRKEPERQGATQRSASALLPHVLHRVARQRRHARGSDSIPGELDR
eukprot:scaffold1801_cov57-Phaeocystis_antarctica.AAC.2